MQKVEKKKFSVGKIVRRVLITIPVVLIGLLVSWALIHEGLKCYEKTKYTAPGEMVEVEGKKIHVFIKGEGEHTIVLMSGLGTVAPALDFEPLIEELSRHNKVVVVEPFGYGFSDQTDQKRSVSNIVGELRTALGEAGIQEKVILMPHSISGLYAMYYANHYPEEVEGIIGIDCTLPKMSDYFNEPLPSVPGVISYLAPIGLVRLEVMLNPEEALPTSGIENYSKENLEATKALTMWQAYNKDVVMEAKEIKNNMTETKEMNFPQDLPVLLFVAKDDKVTPDGKTITSFNQMYLSSLHNGKMIVLDGKHYLHHTESKEMGEAVEAFTKML